MEELLRKGRQNVIEIFREDPSPRSKQRRLESILRTILHPLKSFNDDSATFCYWLLSYSHTFDEYIKTLKSYDTSTVCGLVWNANFFAYRCRDCGISPCMSLCADCFLAGNHEGHDFNMFKSQAGGACDCGDENVMKSSGFCDQHGKLQCCSSKLSVPEELILVPKILIPKLVTCLYEKMKNKYDAENDLSVSVEHIVKFLNKISEVEALREIFCEKILSPINVFVDNQHISSSSNEVTNLISCEASNGRKIIRSVSIETTTIEMTVTNAGHELDEPYKPNELESLSISRGGTKEVCKQTFLQYFMEILVKTEFPSELATLLLQMLPNQYYKEQFTRLFCRQYTAIGKSLSTSDNPDALSNHMVHVSVQLFSNELLALKMVKEENLLFKMIFVLGKMVGECLENYSLQVEGHETSIMAVNCDHKILNGHCYWPVASDLTNILSHQTVTKLFLETGDCLNRWMHFVNMLTGMNVNHLRLLTHVEYESKTYYTAFSIEFESVAAVMWEIYRSVLKMNEKIHVLKMIEVSAAALKDWYSFVPSKMKKPSFTFHLSLHRYFALFASLAVNQFDEDVSKLLPKNIAHSAMNYLISTLAALQEIRSGFWFYNGHQIKCQAQSYMQSYFCNSMLDLDVFFVQIGMVALPPNVILDIMIDRFVIRDWFQFGVQDEDSKNADEDEKMLLEVEAFLNTLLLLFTHHVYTGVSEEQAMRKDLIANLCVADKTHSQLLEVVPTRPGDTQSLGKQFDEVLQSVTNYKSPAVESFTMQQGMYTLKDCVWQEEFDINHIKQRIYKKSDQQQACSRYNQYIQQKGFSTSSKVWPPLRKLDNVHPSLKGMFRILECTKLHQILIFIFHKVVQNLHSVPESMLISTVHLLQLVLTHKPLDKEPNTYVVEDPVIDSTMKYLSLIGQAQAQKQAHLEILNAINKDLEMSSKLSESKENKMDDDKNQEEEVDEDITFFIAEVYHNILFKSMCLHVDSLLTQITMSVAVTYKHMKTLIQQLSDQHKIFLKHLVMYWYYLCHKENIEVEDLPFVMKRSDSKSFAMLLTILFDNFDYIFQVHEPKIGYPYSAFDISLPEKSLSENADFVIDKCRPLIQRDINYYVNKSEKANNAMECDEDSSCSSSKNSETGQCSLLTLLTQVKGLLEETSAAPTSPRVVDNSKVCAGDGSYYIGQLLDGYFASVEEKENKDIKVESPSISSPQRSKQERRRKASEKQKELLAEFATRQKKFMNKIGKDIEVPPETVDDAEQYECVICGQKEESSEDTPIGLIVLLQSSTVLGKRKCTSNSPSMDFDGPGPSRKQAIEKDEDICENFVCERRKAFSPHFNLRSIRSAVECGLDYGINVQTCGHYIHVHCQISYFKSLQDEQTRLLNLLKGEFTCPLCRQMSNAVLPILPTFIRNSKTQDLMIGKTFEERCADITKFLTLYQQGGLTQFTARGLEFTMLTASISTLVQKMEDLTKDCSKPVFDFYYGTDWKWTDKYFLLLASLRQNMESQLLKESSSECSKKKKTVNCLGEVLEVYQFHAQYVSSPPRLRWNELCYGTDELSEVTIAGRTKSSLTYNDVPLLLVESKSLLIQFLLTWPHRISEGEMLHIIQLCYNLTFVQALLVIGVNLEESEKHGWKVQAEKLLGQNTVHLSNYASVIWNRSSFFHCHAGEAMEVEITHSVVSPHAIEMKIQEFCFPFLQLASFVRKTWENITHSKKKVSETQTSFQELISELKLGSSTMEYSVETTSIDCLLWPRDNGIHIVTQWCGAIHKESLIEKNSLSLLPSSISWKKPKLMPLPRLYDSLFQEYRKQKCSRCDTIPCDPTICLVCGGFLCFHGNCCTNEYSINECVQHSIDCGCGTGVFLVISSSVTLVIRESRVTLWGSVYLDSFGEEDKDLRRGKPLFLSDERYARLEEEWTLHILDRSSPRWGIHQNRL